jgi:hypothetical protein
MRYRPVVGWGRLPEGWSFVEATSVAVDSKDNVPPREIRSLQKFALA